MTKSSSSHNNNTHTGILVFLGVAAAASLLAASAATQKQQRRKTHRKTGRALSEVEQYVADSIRVNMPPARRMGITVDRVNLRNRQEEEEVDGDEIFKDAMSSIAPSSPAPAPAPSPAPILLPVEEEEGSLSLSMPIKGNTNIHGTAFAGSLYSLCVLSAWYNLVCHLRATLGDDVLDQATVVAKSAEIAYKKPIWAVAANNEYVVATSFLSSKNKDWSDFIELLQETGKITCNISGEISITEKVEEGNEGEESEETSVVAVQFKALLCVLLPRPDGED